MPKLVVTDLRTGTRTGYDLPEDGALAIGRVETQDIVLNHNKVSRRHAEFLCRNGVIKIRDNGSSNGTYLNKKRLEKGEETVVFSGDKIRVAEFEFQIFENDDLAREVLKTTASATERSAGREGIEDDEAQPAKAAAPAAKSAPSSGPAIRDLDAMAAPGPAKGGIVDLDQDFGVKTPTPSPEPPPTPTPPVAPAKATPPPTLDETRAESEGSFEDNYKPSSFGWDKLEKSRNAVRKRLSDEDRKKLQILFEIKNTIQDRILQYMDLRNMDFTSTRLEELRNRTQNVIRDIISELGDQIPRWASKKQIAKEVLDEALGLGPLEDLLADESITEVMVNAYDQIYIERSGKLEEANARFSNNEAVRAVIERIVGPIGRRIDESSPMVDARLKDGSRVNAIIPPLALKGPCITIRKFSKSPYKLDDLIRFGSLNDEIAVFLKASVAARKNIIVSGGTGSGKTTLLNVLSNFIPDDERIVTIENIAELQLSKEHWVALESRPPNIEGRGEISVRDLVKNSLRMRPDRIVVGECRGGETIDMIQAMNTGHDGSLTTLHSNQPSDTLARIETMSLMAGMDLPIKAIREQVMSAVDLIVHSNRMSDGTRRVSHVTEVLREVDEHYRIQTRDIFRFVQTGLGEHGEVLGEIRPTGYRPTFLRELALRGFPVDESLFDPRGR